MNTATETIADRVQAGAALLDQAYVNRDVAWWDQVDLDKLDMYSPTTCVLAQTLGRYEGTRPCWCGNPECEDTTIGSYGNGLEVLGLRDRPDGWAVAHGFCPELGGSGTLRAAWSELILARRASAVPSE